MRFLNTRMLAVKYPTLRMINGRVDDRKRVSAETPLTMIPFVISRYCVTGSNSLYQYVNAGMLSLENIRPERMIAGTKTTNSRM